MGSRLPSEKTTVGFRNNHPIVSDTQVNDAYVETHLDLHKTYIYIHVCSEQLVWIIVLPTTGDVLLIVQRKVHDDDRRFGSLTHMLTAKLILISNSAGALTPKKGDIVCWNNSPTDINCSS